LQKLHAGSPNPRSTTHLHRRFEPLGNFEQSSALPQVKSLDAVTFKESCSEFSRWGVGEHATVILWEPATIATESKNLLWILALGGAAFCGYVVVQFVRYRGSDNWPATAATVEKIEVRRIQDSDSHHFSPVVSFSFAVSENYYSGEWVGPAFSTEQETRDFMQQNTSIGTKLSAKYKPNNPNMNLLDIDPALWDKGRPITLGL